MTVKTFKHAINGITLVYDIVVDMSLFSAWKDKKFPVCRKVSIFGSSWIIIAGSNCIKAFSAEDEEKSTYILEIKCPTQEFAKTFLRGIGENRSLISLGFTQDCWWSVAA